MKNSLGAMNDSRTLDFVNSVSLLCPLMSFHISLHDNLLILPVVLDMQYPMWKV